MQAELILLGTGDAESLRFWNTNGLVRADGRRVLIDCGFTIKYALADVGLSLRDVDAVFVTHIHGDHVFGLERLGFESRYVFHKRVTLYLEPELYPLLWEDCLKGCMGHTSCGSNRLEDFFDVRIIDGHAFTEGGCRFETFATPHTVGKPSFGVTLNGKVSFTSDTKVIPSLVTQSSAELIIHDCCLRASNPAHATLSELVAHYPLALRKKMMLIHYGDQIDLHRQHIEREFLGIAQQGQTISLEPVAEQRPAAVA